jgi:hypothetical protein
MAMQTKIVLAASTENSAATKQLRDAYSATLVTVSMPYDLWRAKCATFPDPITMLTYQDDGIDWIEIDCDLWYAMQMAEVVGVKALLVDIDVIE